MSKKDDFYIGYVDKIASPIKKKIKTVFFFTVLLLLAAIIFNISQKAFWQ